MCLLLLLLSKIASKTSVAWPSCSATLTHPKLHAATIAFVASWRESMFAPFLSFWPVGFSFKHLCRQLNNLMEQITSTKCQTFRDTGVHCKCQQARATQATQDRLIREVETCLNVLHTLLDMPSGHTRVEISGHHKFAKKLISWRLHLCWEGDVFHSRWACREKSQLLLLDECPCCGCLGFAKVQLSIRWKRVSSEKSSSSLVSSSFKSWTPVACVVCSCVVGWVVVVVLVEVVGCAGCLSLLFMNSPSIAPHF